jgi:hypothetical protein
LLNKSFVTMIYYTLTQFHYSTFFRSPVPHLPFHNFQSKFEFFLCNALKHNKKVYSSSILTSIIQKDLLCKYLPTLALQHWIYSLTHTCSRVLQLTCLVWDL